MYRSRLFEWHARWNRRLDVICVISTKLQFNQNGDAPSWQEKFYYIKNYLLRQVRPSANLMAKVISKLATSPPLKTMVCTNLPGLSKPQQKHTLPRHYKTSYKVHYVPSICLSGWFQCKDIKCYNGTIFIICTWQNLHLFKHSFQNISRNVNTTMTRFQDEMCQK